MLIRTVGSSPTFRKEFSSCNLLIFAVLAVGRVNRTMGSFSQLWNSGSPKRWFQRVFADLGFAGGSEGPDYCFPETTASQTIATQGLRARNVAGMSKQAWSAFHWWFEMQAPRAFALWGCGPGNLLCHPDDARSRPRWCALAEGTSQLVHQALCGSGQEDVQGVPAGVFVFARLDRCLAELILGHNAIAPWWIAPGGLVV